MSSPGFSPTKKMGSGGSSGGSSLLAPSKFNFGQTEPKKLFTGLKASKLAGVSQGLGLGAAGADAENPFKTTTTSIFGSSSAESKDAKPAATSEASSPNKTESDEGQKTGPEVKPSSAEASKEVTAAKPSNPFTAVAKEKEPEGAFVFGQNLADRAANFPKEPAKPEKEVLKEDSTKQGGFLFGQNLADRAENFAETSSPDEGGKTENEDKENGQEKKDEVKPAEAAEKSAKTLSENAAEYFENKAASKRKYEEVEVTTGEENEFNVIQTRAKLYIFDNCNYVERGRGLLRLNDMSKDSSSDLGSKRVSSSRIVMRTMGSLKVILNTKVYHGMTVEQPNEKSVRLTGMDDSGAVKVFLVVTSQKDASALHKALMSRLMELKPASGCEDTSGTSDADCVTVKKCKTVVEEESSEDQSK